MTEKIFLDDQNHATFKCPKCSKSWTKDLSGFKDTNKRIQLKCKCPCGHVFPVIQERRKGLRRSVTVTGAYFHNQREIRGLITVKNISKSGVGLVLSTKQSINKGDKLQLKFNLDNARKSFVDKEGVVKKIENDYLGVEFIDEAWGEELKDYFSGD
ncbi:MAG: PilZ domain-containing protein [Desulfobacterales bacterium]|nr:PilZ domain-containing protein [Desulfobacterales bacterium]